MSFLSPLFLLGLLAAAIPLAIHLIRRENPPKVMFGSLRFLKQTTRKLILFQQIQQWLLLLLRAALICLVVFAFARPLLHQGTMARLVDAAPQSVVLLLDTSLSMRFGDRFERARAQALEVLDELSAGDEAAVITFAGATLGVRELTTDLGSLRNYVRELEQPGYDRVRFFPALRLANDMLTQSRHVQRSIVMLSDFQANGLSDSDQGWMLLPGVAFQGIDVGDERSSNLSLTDVRSPAQLTDSETEYEVLTRVRSTGTVFQERGNLTLRINDQVMGQQAVDLADRSEAVLTLPVALEGSGSYRGELLLSSDDFEPDNRWFFTLDVLPRMRVLVVNGDPSADWYDDEAHWFVLALQGMENSPFVVTPVSEAELTEALLAGHDTVVLLNTGNLANAQRNAVQRFVETGGSVWFAPGDRVEAGIFNQLFNDLSPAQLLNSNLLPANDYMLIADVDRRHPALAPLDVDWNARFQGYWSTQPGDQASVLMRFDSGEPMLIERTVGQGRSIMLSSSLDLGWSNFPLQGLYLPFVHELLGYLIQPPQRQRAWQVGDMIDLTEQFQDAIPGSAASSLLLTEPDGGRATVNRDNPFYQARMPGFVRGPADLTLAVNIAPQAAVLTKMDVALLSDRILNPETTPPVSQQVRTAQLIAELEQPQRLWWWILLVVAALVIVETWVANRTYR